MVGYVGTTNLEKPLALVLLIPEHEASAELEHELQEFVRSKTARYKYPCKIKFVDNFPRTAAVKSKGLNFAPC